MPLFDVFWAMLWFFLFIAWIWVVVAVIMDVFRSDDMGGFAKALWTIFIIVLPWLGVLIYLIARGSGMAERSAKQAADSEAATRQYIRETAGTTSTADELQKLAALRDSGALTDEEFAAHKAKLLA